MKSREEIEKEVEFIIASVLTDTLCGTNVMETRNKVLPKVMSLFDEVLAERDEAKGEAERAKQLHHSDGEKLITRSRRAERRLREVYEQFKFNKLAEHPVAVEIASFLAEQDKPFEKDGVSPFAADRSECKVDGKPFLLDSKTAIAAQDPRDIIKPQHAFSLPCYVDDEGHICEVNSRDNKWLNRIQLSHLCNIAYNSQRNYTNAQYWEETARKRAELHSETARRNVRLKQTLEDVLNFLLSTIDWNTLPASVRAKGREVLQRHAISAPVTMADVHESNGVKFSDLCPEETPTLAAPVLPPFPWRTGKVTGCGIFDANDERVASGADADGVGENGKVADGHNRDQLIAAFIVRTCNDFARTTGLIKDEPNRGADRI